jgi:hypothetical protein
MYRPEVPQGQLSRQHFSHLSRLMKYIEPQTNGLYAFAIGNLSRDDTQYEPGHGGVALIFGLRIRGVTDHAGRQDPPFAHGIAAIDRALDFTTLFAAATLFHRRVLGAAEAAEWYRTYVRCATDSPADVEHVLSGYVNSFSDLPRTNGSTLSAKWITAGAAQPKRIVIVHEDGAPFETIARCAARIAAMLYRSDVRWTSISNGREADVPNGVSIRLISDRDFNPTDTSENVRRIQEIPEDEAGIAQKLFGAKPTQTGMQPMVGWRERYASVAPDTFDPANPQPSVLTGEGQHSAGPSSNRFPIPSSSKDPGRGAKPGMNVPLPTRPGSDPMRRLKPSVMHPSSAPGSDPLRGAKSAVKPGEDDTTHIWEGRADALAAETEGDDEIQVDTTAMEASPPPAVIAPAGVVVLPASRSEAVRPVANGGKAGMPLFAPAGPAKAIGTERVVVPAVRPLAEKPRPASASAPTLIGPTKASLAAKQWEPSPNFRKPTARSPMLRWTLMTMALASVILVVLYFVFTGTPVPYLDVLKSYLDASPPPRETVKAEPAPPPPTPAPTPAPAPAPAAPPSAAPPVTVSATATASSAASSKAAASAKASSGKAGESGKGTKRPPSVFDAPLNLGKDE